MSVKVPYIHSNNIHNFNSAYEIIPYLIEIFKPNSILDVGCGTGTWLKVAQDYGVQDILGIDGHYINQDHLEIDKLHFIAFDLQQTLNIGRKYSMVFCLEVAEHLDEIYADNLIAGLVKHSDIIIFSAALPGQGGQNHLNEQPFEYWFEKFNKHGYTAIDIIRDKFWNNNNVDWWYKQNAFVITNRIDILNAFKNEKSINTYIHPTLFRLYVKEFSSLKMVYSSPVKILKSCLSKLFRRN